MDLSKYEEIIKILKGISYGVAILTGIEVIKICFGLY